MVLSTLHLLFTLICIYLIQSSVNGVDVLDVKLQTPTGYGDPYCSATYYIKFTEPENSSTAISSDSTITNSRFLFRENNTIVYSISFRDLQIGFSTPIINITNSIDNATSIRLPVFDCMVFPNFIDYLFSPPTPAPNVPGVFYFKVYFNATLPRFVPSCVVNTSAYWCEFYVSGGQGYGKIFTSTYDLSLDFNSPILLELFISKFYILRYEIDPLYPINNFESKVNGLYQFPNTTYVVLYNTIEHGLIVFDVIDSGDSFVSSPASYSSKFTNLFPIEGNSSMMSFAVISNTLTGLEIFQIRQSDGVQISKFDFPIIAETPMPVLNGLENATIMMDNGFNMVSFNSDLYNFADVKFNIDLQAGPFNLPPRLVPYPYGYQRHRFNNSLQFKSTGHFSTFISDLNVEFINNGQVTRIQKNVPSKIIDSSPPVLLNIKTFTISLETIVIEMEITDDLSGLNYIMIGSKSYYAPKYLSSGTPYNGTYIIDFEIECPEQFEAQPPIVLQDKALNQIQLDSNCYNFKMNRLEPIEFPVLYKLDISEITSWKFEPNNIDTSKGPTDVVLTFNISHPNVNFKPHLRFFFGNQNTQPDTLAIDKYARWEPVLHLYIVEFQVPQNLYNGTIRYTFNEGLNQTMESTYIDNVLLVNYFNSDIYSLKVTSQYLDQIGPLVLSYQSLMPQLIIARNETKSIGFQFTIYDYNGIVDGVVKYGDRNIDGMDYTVPFKEWKLVSGDTHTGVWEVSTTITGECSSQEFALTYIKLVDSAGYLTESPILLQEYTGKTSFNSLFKLTGDAAKPIKLVCDPYTDLILPKISRFNVSGTVVDVGKADPSARTLYFYLETNDDLQGSGLSNRHDPVIYLSTESYQEVLTITPYNKTLNNRPLYPNTYQYQIEIPYGFGVGSQILISIYGIVDNELNIAGYTSSDLMSNGLQYTIQTNYSSEPFISSTTSIYREGGIISIHGRNLGSGNGTITAYINYRANSNSVPTKVQLLFVHGVFALVNSTNLIVSDYITLQINTTNGLSNMVKIYPIDHIVVPPIPNPVSCLTSAKGVMCSGNGNCTVDGCKCFGNYTGPDCSSLPIYVPPPLSPGDEPTIIFDGGQGIGNTHLRSIVSIRYIRELDLEGKIVQQYTFPNWTFSNLTADTYKYKYSTLLLNRPTTFNVTTEWFTNTTSIDFAGDVVHIVPYTLKISMSLDHYTFGSVFNTLQIVVEVVFGSDEGQCSSKSYGLGGNNINDLQWMKLKIDDKSLFGNFIRRGVIDGKNLAISNSIVDIPTTDTSTSTQTFIGINLPRYNNNVYIDPDFSHVLNVDNDGETNQICNGSSDGKKKLTTGQIAGIVMGCLIAASIAVSAVIYYKKRREENLQTRMMERKLSNRI